MCFLQKRIICSVYLATQLQAASLSITPLVSQPRVTQIVEGSDGQRRGS